MTWYARSAGKNMGWLRHVLTLLSVLIFIIGCILIGYMAWVMATSVTVHRFLNGDMFWSYSVITLGFSLFFSGLVGWVGGASESICLVRLFLVMIVLCMAAEIGGIIALTVFEKSIGDVLHLGWKEVNQESKNIIQRQLECCGWEGVKEFAGTSSLIDDSCYERITPSLSGIVAREDNEDTTRRMKQHACQDRLMDWFEDNKIIWVTVLAALAAIQLMVSIIAIYIIQKVKKIAKMRKSRTVSKRHLYDSSSDGSHSDDNKYLHRI